MKISGALLFGGRGGGDPAGGGDEGPALGPRGGEVCVRDGGGAALIPSRSGSLEELLEESLSGALEGDVAAEARAVDDTELFPGIELVPAGRGFPSVVLGALVLAVGREEAAPDGLVLSSDAAALLAVPLMAAFNVVLAGVLAMGLEPGRCLGSSNSTSPSSSASSDSEMKVARSSCSVTADGTLGFFAGAFDGAFDGWAARR